MDHSPLVSTTWLAEHLADRGLRVFDTTVHLEPTRTGFQTRSGHTEYLAKHIPGAGFLDTVSDLSDARSDLAFTRPPPGQIADVLSRSGVSNENHVVLYSAGDVMWAARAWWLLRWVGIGEASVLDGGLTKWNAEGRPFSREPCRYPEAEFDAQPIEGCWATKEAVLDAIKDGGVCTLNSLPRPLHTGAAGLGYSRSGRIAGSENVPFSELLEPTDGAFRAPSELREHFGPTGALEKDRVICYCGGGIAATQNALALVLLGHPNVAVYDGGLDEWSRDLELPMEMDESIAR